jgi:hypothetical protein
MIFLQRRFLHGALCITCICRLKGERELSGGCCYVAKNNS